MVSSITGGIRRALLYIWVYIYGAHSILVASVAAGFVLFHATARASLDGQSDRKSILPAGLRSFEIFSSEAVSEINVALAFRGLDRFTRF